MHGGRGVAVYTFTKTNGSIYTSEEHSRARRNAQRTPGRRGILEICFTSNRISQPFMKRYRQDAASATAQPDSSSETRQAEQQTLPHSYCLMD